MRCPNCNAEVSESAFCENCGSRLIPDDAQPEQVDAVIAPIEQSSEGLDVFVTDPVGSQQDQTYGAYDAAQPANAYDATQPAYGYDQSQQAYGYDQNQQAYGNDPNQQQPYSYDATQQQPYTYDATQQMPYGSGQPDYQAPQGGPYAPPTGQQSYGYTQPPMQEPSKAPFVLSIIALVLSILGLFPISIVLAIIALVMNSGQKKRGEVSTKQTPTTIMSVISLVFSVLMAIFTAIVGGAIWVAVMNGEFGSSSHSSSTSTVVTTSSSSSSKSSSAASSSKSASAASSSKSASAASSSASAAASAASSSDAVGTWTIDSMEYGGETYTSEELAYLRELDMEVNLVINGDGTVDFEIFGVPESGTWADKGGGTITLTFAGDSTDVTISGDELTMVDGSDKLVFIRKS